MTDDLRELADSVNDERSFVRFLRALGADWSDEMTQESAGPRSSYGAGLNGWESQTIGAFLEQAAAWAEDSQDGFVGYALPSNPWRRCAHILLMGKIYE